MFDLYSKDFWTDEKVNMMKTTKHPTGIWGYIFESHMGNLGQYLVENFMPDVHPNSITICGQIALLCQVLVSVVLAKYCANDYVLLTLLLSNVICVVAYSFCDIMDGKQARYRNLSSATGSLLDHATDAHAPYVQALANLVLWKHTYDFAWMPAFIALCTFTGFSLAPLIFYEAAINYDSSTYLEISDLLTPIEGQITVIVAGLVIFIYRKTSAYIPLMIMFLLIPLASVVYTSCFTMKQIYSNSTDRNTFYQFVLSAFLVSTVYYQEMSSQNPGLRTGAHFLILANNGWVNVKLVLAKFIKQYDSSYDMIGFPFLIGILLSIFLPSHGLLDTLLGILSLGYFYLSYTLINNTANALGEPLTGKRAMD